MPLERATPTDVIEDAADEVVVGSGNPRDAYFKQLADANDERTEEQIVAGGDDAPEEVVEEPVADEPVAEPRKLKLKVNGREIELTEDEVIARAQKVEAADQYLADAKRAAEQITKPAPSQDAPVAVVAPKVDDDLALARAIQMGTEEEAARVIKQLRTPSVKPDELAQMVDDRITFQSAAAKFKSDFSDVFSDPYLASLALTKDTEMLKAGDKRPYMERYTEIGTSLRAWRDGLAKPVSLNEKRERKASAPTVPSGNARPAPRSDEDKEETPSAIIAAMAKTRGQSLES